MRTDSFKTQPQSELKERSAALNTQLRFGRERAALVHAYKLRTYLQLRGAKLEAEQRELERVEKVISELEKRKTSGIQRLIKTLIETAKASLSPDIDDESTLLDQFREPMPLLDDDEEDGVYLADTVLAKREPSDNEEDGWDIKTPVEAEAGSCKAPVDSESSHWGSEGYHYDDHF